VNFRLLVRLIAAFSTIVPRAERARWREEWLGLRAAVLLLCSAGVSAMMSFTVAQRRKEIGIRAALGADPSRIVRSIFSRAFAQLAAGAIVGGIAAVLLEKASDGDLMNGHAAVVLPIVAVFMMLIGLLAALGPARLAFPVHPTEALRQE